MVKLIIEKAKVERRYKSDPGMCVDIFVTVTVRMFDALFDVIKMGEIFEYEDSDIEAEVLLVSYIVHEDTVDVELTSTGAVAFSPDVCTYKNPF